MTSSPRVQGAPGKRRRLRAGRVRDVLSCSAWALAVWVACLAATVAASGPAAPVDLAVALTVLPGAIAASLAARALWSVDGLPASGPVRPGAARSKLPRPLGP